MKRQWETEELVEHWTLDIEDRTLLGNKTGATRLGFAVLLKFFRQEGRFPQHKNEVPSIVITFLATQVGIDASAYVQYAWQGRTIEYHRAQIREALGFRESTVADAEQMQQWLITEVLPQEHQDERLREQTYAWFRRMHLEAPTPDRLTRLIRSAAHTFEQQFYEATLARLPEASQAALEALLLTEIATSEVRILTPMYNCARIKLTTPRDGCSLCEMLFTIHTGGSHDQEPDNEYDTRISNTRQIDSRHCDRTWDRQKHGAQVLAPSRALHHAPSAAQPPLQTRSVQRTDQEVDQRGPLLQL